MPFLGLLAVGLFDEPILAGCYLLRMCCLADAFVDNLKLAHVRLDLQMPILTFVERMELVLEFQQRLLFSHRRPKSTFPLLRGWRRPVLRAGSVIAHLLPVLHRIVFSDWLDWRHQRRCLFILEMRGQVLHRFLFVLAPDVDGVKCLAQDRLLVDLLVNAPLVAKGKRVLV